MAIGPRTTLGRPSVYTDLNGLAPLKRAARRGPDQALDQVARQFESLFVTTLLKGMRRASVGDPIFDGQSTRLYREMSDSQLALSVSEQRGLGFADMLVRELRGLGRNGDAAASPAGRPQAPLRRGPLPPVPVRERVPAPEPVPVPARAAAPGAPAAGATGSLRQEFIAAVRPHAERAAAELGVDPDLLIAQAALESGWGRSAMRRADGGSANNLFGIKAGSRWGGERVEASTREFQDGQPRAERAAFRAYASVADSFADYVDLLRSSPRYRDALAQAHDPEAFMQGLQSAGYATDPAYAQKVLRIWRRQVARA